MVTKVGACQTTYKITVGDVTNVVTNIKTGKSDGSEGLKSDHFINGTNKLYATLSLLCTSFCPMVLVLIQ